MKKLLFIALLYISTTAMAADKATSSAAGKDAKPAAAKHEMKFEDRKAKALDRLSKRITELQQKQSCVEAATTSDALKACFPKREERAERRQRWMKERSEGREEGSQEKKK